MQIVYEKSTKNVHIILSVDEASDLQGWLYTFSPSLTRDNQLPADMHKRMARLLRWYMGLPENTPKQKGLFDAGKAN